MLKVLRYDKDKTMEDGKHVHRFKRFLDEGKRTNRFFCIASHCSFTSDASLLAGKIASCYYCKTDFIIERKHLAKHGLLHCNECTARMGKKKLVKSVEEITAILAVIPIGVNEELAAKDEHGI